MKYGTKLNKNYEHKKIDSELLFGDKYLITKTKFYNQTINTNFKNVENKSTKSLNEWIKCIFLSVIVTDDVFKLIKYYYLETFLEKFKCKMRKERESLVKYDLENYSSHDFEEEKEEDFEENSE